MSFETNLATVTMILFETNLETNFEMCECVQRNLEPPDQRHAAGIITPIPRATAWEVRREARIHDLAILELALEVGTLDIELSATTLRHTPVRREELEGGVADRRRERLDVTPDLRAVVFCMAPL